jgi:carbon storage regulator
MTWLSRKQIGDCKEERNYSVLVLRRKIGESIILDGVISVSVLAVEGERVKIGITAPPEVTIVREELLKNAPDLPKPNAAAISQ